MPNSHAKSYGLTDLATDIWLGQRLSREIESIGSQRRTAIDNSKQDKPQKDQGAKEMTKHKARQAEQKVIRVCCLWPYTNNPSNSRFVTAAQKDTKASDGGGFTDIQDRQLIKLKIEEKKPWKEIATELGKDIGEVKERWQKVRPDKQGDDKPEGEAKKDDKQEANKKEKRKDSAIALGFAELAAIEVEPDEHFGLNELNVISDIITDEMEDMWARVSYRFWALTDRQLHPFDIREKFTGQIDG